MLIQTPPWAHFRGRVSRYWSEIGHGRIRADWRFEVVNTASGRVIATDAPFRTPADAADTARESIHAAYVAWMRGYSKGDLRNKAREVI